MKQIQFLPRNIFADHSHRANRKGIDDQIHCRDLNENRNQLFCDNTHTADRMCQQKFGRSVLFLFAENADCTQSRIKCSAKSQYIAAFNGIVADQCAKAQPVHTKGSGEGTHRREHLADSVQLAFHFRKKKYTNCKQSADRTGPDQKRHFPLPEFMFHDRHALSPSFS